MKPTLRLVIRTKMPLGYKSNGIFLLVKKKFQNFTKFLQKNLEISKSCRTFALSNKAKVLCLKINTLTNKKTNEMANITIEQRIIKAINKDEIVFPCEIMEVMEQKLGNKIRKMSYFQIYSMLWSMLFLWENDSIKDELLEDIDDALKAYRKNKGIEIPNEKEEPERFERFKVLSGMALSELNETYNDCLWYGRVLIGGTWVYKYDCLDMARYLEIELTSNNVH